MSPRYSPRKILIDTDPGIDDAMAIFYALESPELEVVGLTTVFGNAHTSVCTTNALKLLEIAERTDIPVAQGVDAPLAMPYRGPVAFVHGEDGQGDVFLPPPKTSPLPIDAANFIIQTVMDAPGQITLVRPRPADQRRRGDAARAGAVDTRRRDRVDGRQRVRRRQRLSRRPRPTSSTIPKPPTSSSEPTARS